jgi:hypothetical protein
MYKPGPYGQGCKPDPKGRGCIRLSSDTDDDEDDG